MRRKRVLNVVTLASSTGKYGGPYDTSVRQALLASELGCDSTLFAGVLKGDEPEVNIDCESLRSSFHRVRRLLPVRGFIGFHSWTAIRALVTEVRNADVVHVSVSRELVPISAVILAVVFRKRMLVQTHGMMTSRTSSMHRLLDLLIRPLLIGAAGVIALTSTEAEELEAWFHRSSPPISILGNPLPRGLHPRSRDAPSRGDVVFIARLHPRKRVDLFIGAANMSHRNGWDEKYSVVGPDEGDLHLVHSASQDPGNFFYEGTLSSAGVTERVRNCDVFVLSSENEPWGNVLAIAIASGVPVVVPESAALAKRVREYGAGIVVPDNDSTAIAIAVHSLLNSSEKYKTACAGARNFAKLELSLEHQLTELSRLYELTI